jgi:CheY-like chemotaxis protein
MSAGASKRVLVVDDQEEVARVLLLMLMQQGHTVEVARTGSDAVEKAAQFAPDVILLDLVLPDARGERVAARLRAQKPTARIVGMTGGLVDEETADAFDEVLQKPFSFEALKRVL